MPHSIPLIVFYAALLYGGEAPARGLFRAMDTSTPFFSGTATSSRARNPEHWVLGAGAHVGPHDIIILSTN